MKAVKRLTKNKARVIANELTYYLERRCTQLNFGEVGATNGRTIKQNIHLYTEGVIKLLMEISELPPPERFTDAKDTGGSYGDAYPTHLSILIDAHMPASSVTTMSNIRHDHHGV
jgi:hypothetical protein